MFQLGRTKNLTVRSILTHYLVMRIRLRPDLGPFEASCIYETTMNMFNPIAEPPIEGPKKRFSQFAKARYSFTALAISLFFCLYLLPNNLLGFELTRHQIDSITRSSITAIALWAIWAAVYSINYSEKGLVGKNLVSFYISSVYAATLFALPELFTLGSACTGVFPTYS